MYFKAIDMLEARRELAMVNSASFPHSSEKQKRRDYHKSLHKRAYFEDNNNVLTTEELFKRLG